MNGVRFLVVFLSSMIAACVWFRVFFLQQIKGEFGIFLNNFKAVTVVGVASSRLQFMPLAFQGKRDGLDDFLTPRIGYPNSYSCWPLLFLIHSLSCKPSVLQCRDLDIASHFYLFPHGLTWENNKWVWL